MWDPIPNVDIKFLYDVNQLYPVLKIEGEDIHRPYFVKGSGQCFVRIGASISPASRITVLNLFTNIVAKRTDVERLRSSAARFSERKLTFTCKNIRDINPVNVDTKILAADLTLYAY